MVICTPAQCRAARDVLGWSRVRLQGVAGVSETAIARFEQGLPVQARLKDMICDALHGAGIEFLDAPADGLFVRLARPASEAWDEPGLSVPAPEYREDRPHWISAGNLAERGAGLLAHARELRALAGRKAAYSAVARKQADDSQRRAVALRERLSRSSRWPRGF